MTWLGEPVRPGSLLKPDFAEKRKKIRPEAEGQRKPREKKPGHLAAIRQCQCLNCGADQGSDPAHLRASKPGKPNPGVGQKPDDKWVNPLCRRCHNEQHRGNELAFWKKAGIDPFKTAVELYHLSLNVEAMRDYVSKIRSAK